MPNRSGWARFCSIKLVRNSPGRSSASPDLIDSDLVELEDPQHMFLSSQVVPLASAKLSADDIAAINEVQAKLTEDSLRQMNKRSTDSGESAAQIAKDWLAGQI